MFKVSELNIQVVVAGVKEETLQFNLSSSY